MSTQTRTFRYPRKQKGDSVVKAFQRLVQTGDVEKITPALYHCLTQSGGFIAHFNLHGFREVYRGRVGELIAGEFYPLDIPARWQVDRMQHLEDSGYADGMSAGDVMRDIATLARNGGGLVRQREETARFDAEVAALRARYGITEDAALDLVRGRVVA